MPAESSSSIKCPSRDRPERDTKCSSETLELCTIFINLQPKGTHCLSQDRWPRSSPRVDNWLASSFPVWEDDYRMSPRVFTSQLHHKWKNFLCPLKTSGICLPGPQIQVETSVPLWAARTGWHLTRIVKSCSDKKVCFFKYIKRLATNGGRRNTACVCSQAGLSQLIRARTREHETSAGIVLSTKCSKLLLRGSDELKSVGSLGSGHSEPPVACFLHDYLARRRFERSQPCVGVRRESALDISFGE